ncbi:MAG: DUF1844 domain-containing protein [Desulfomonile tiedjei]|nr:DUF1844 domain-containing protein [Desulfomonile tiedjei]
MDDSEPKEEFKVTDKRRFTSEGESQHGEEAKESSSVRQEPPPEPQKTDQAGERQPPPKIDFSTLVMSLANTALFQLGLIKASESEEPQKDLNGARQTIDILGLLEEKTRGNLTDQEQAILKETLFQLRMVFVEASK